MLTSLAHTAVCVPDVEEAVRWYESVLGFTVIWSPVLMENDDIEKDMGELIPKPVAVKPPSSARATPASAVTGCSRSSSTPGRPGGRKPPTSQ